MLVLQSGVMEDLLFHQGILGACITFDQCTSHPRALFEPCGHSTKSELYQRMDDNVKLSVAEELPWMGHILYGMH